MSRREFTTWEVQASYKVNTVLARALFKALSWGEYDRFNAHTWALRVIDAKPQTGADLAAAVMNFDHMADAGRNQYETNPRRRRRCDEALAAYAKWAALQKEVA